jgi:hypothetical protein
VAEPPLCCLADIADRVGADPDTVHEFSEQLRNA